MTEAQGTYKRIKEEMAADLQLKSMEINNMVQAAKKDWNSRMAARNEAGVVRKLRDGALEKFSAAKSSLCVIICDDIDNFTSSPGIAKLKSLNSEMIQHKADKNKVGDQITEISKNKKSEQTWSKFLNYSEHQPDLFNPLQRKFNNELKRASSIGVLVTSICAATDFFMLNTMFILGNLGTGAAMLSGIIFALMLNGPPYILGWLSGKRIDVVKLDLMKGTKSANRAAEQKKFKTAIGVLMLLVAVILTFYVITRTFFFLGEGDFGVAFRDVMSGQFTISTVNLEAADLLASLIPIATTVVSYVIGLFIFPSKAEFVKNSVLTVDAGLSKTITIKKGQILDSEANIDSKQKEHDTLQKELWGQYLPDTPFEKDYDKFVIRLSEAYKNRCLTSYREIYKACSSKILHDAQQKLIDIVNEIAPIAQGDQIAIYDMAVDEHEQAKLNRLWVACDDINPSRDPLTSLQQEYYRQTLTTKMDIDTIEGKIADISKKIFTVA